MLPRWILAATLILVANHALAEEPLPKPVVAFFDSYCIDCHNEVSAEGNFAAESLFESKRLTDHAGRWEQVLSHVATRFMPPKEAEQPSIAERAQISGWIRQQLAEEGHRSEWERKLLFPEYGNLIDHDSLFDGTHREPAYTPSRLWKKSPYLFDSLVIRGMELGQGRYGSISSRLVKTKQPFAIEDKSGIKDFAAILYADSATLSTMLRNAEVIVDQHLSGAMLELDEKLNGPTPDDQLPKDKNGKPIRPRPHNTCAEFRAIVMAEETPTAEQIEAAIGKMYQLVIEREPESDELAKYSGLMRHCIDQGGNAEGLRMTLIAIAVSPPAVYRLELGNGPADEHGRRMLSPANLAYSIAYALTDNKPDEALLEAARSGQLATRDDVAREVNRLWDDGSIEKPRVLRFFREFFGYDRAVGVFKDDARFGENYTQLGVAQLVVNDADTLVMHFVKEDRDVLGQLLTSDKYFVAHDGDNAEQKRLVEVLWKFHDYYKDKPWKDFPYQVPKEHMDYVRSLDRMFTHANGNVTRRWMTYLTACHEAGIDPIPWNGRREYIAAYGLSDKTFDFPTEQPFELPVGERAGMLMHPAWLIAHSLNLDNDPVRRGKWIRERLLADTVPELPITVDARIPEAPDQSLRERFSVTREEKCWRCHEKMNPLGMPFELFDDFGRYREVEKLHAPKMTKPVDSSGSLDTTGNSALDGPVENPIEMMHRLAKSDRVRQSFVRHAFRYFMGRNETLADSATLIAADEAYVAGGGSFRALVISLLTSDSFLYRKSSPEQTQRSSG